MTKLFLEVIKVKTYYLKQGQSSFFKTIKVSEDICEIYNLLENTKLKKIEKIVKKLKHYEINSVVLSKKIHLISDFVNMLNSHEISIFDGKWLGQYLILDIIEKLEKNAKILEGDEVAILANDLTEEVKGNIIALLKKYKKVKIITNHAEKFKKLENDLFEKDGVAIIISNNKKKSLLKAGIIINFDFVEEEINKYNINENAIIISIDEKIKINKKRFSGIIITDYEVKEKENSHISQQTDLMPEGEEFYKKEIYEGKIYNELVGRTQLSEANCSKYEIVRNIIKEHEMEIDEIYGLNGKI